RSGRQRAGHPHHRGDDPLRVQRSDGHRHVGVPRPDRRRRTRGPRRPLTVTSGVGPVTPQARTQDSAIPMGTLTRSTTSSAIWTRATHERESLRRALARNPARAPTRTTPPRVTTAGDPASVATRTRAEPTL